MGRRLKFNYILLSALLLLSSVIVMDCSNTILNEIKADILGLYADFQASQTSGYARLTVQFEDNSGGKIETWEWDFDNNGVIDSTGQNPTYTYNSAGEYSVRLRITANGFSNEILKEKYITVSYGPPEKIIVIDDAENPCSISAGDVNGDGDMDIVVVFDNNDDTKVGCQWLQNSDGSGFIWFDYISRNVNNRRSVFAADINGDDKVDAVTCSGGEIIWIESGGPYLVGSPSDAVSVCAADLDGDNDMDVVDAEWGSDRVALWQNANGIGTAWNYYQVAGSGSPTGAGYRNSVYAADIDGDGDNDIISLGNWEDFHSIDWWENVGTIDYWEHKHQIHDDRITGLNNKSGDHSVYVIDMDTDGDMDVVGAFAGLNAVYWWENLNGIGTSWDSHLVVNNFSEVWSIYAGDLDSDSDIDIVGVSPKTDTIAWWENANGSGTSWIQHEVDTNFEEAIGVCIADINGDGDLDIIGAEGVDTNAEIAWWDILR